MTLFFRPSVRMSTMHIGQKTLEKALPYFVCKLKGESQGHNAIFKVLKMNFRTIILRKKNIQR